MFSSGLLKFDDTMWAHGFSVSFWESAIMMLLLPFVARAFPSPPAAVTDSNLISHSRLQKQLWYHLVFYVGLESKRCQTFGIQKLFLSPRFESNFEAFQDIWQILVRTCGLLKGIDDDRSQSWQKVENLTWMSTFSRRNSSLFVNSVNNWAFDQVEFEGRDCDLRGRKKRKVRDQRLETDFGRGKECPIFESNFGPCFFGRSSRISSSEKRSFIPSLSSHESNGAISI